MIARLIGRIVRRPAVRNWLITRAKRTPEWHINGEDGSVYMYRFWLFNPIENQKRRYPFIPFSLRVHGIMRADQDRHPHDHPWPARTWIMDGWYFERRLEVRPDHVDENWTELREIDYRRVPGDTAKLGVRQYHRITSVSPGGAWTLFMFGRYREQWGFLVDGEKIGFRQYALRKQCKAVSYGDSTICDTCGLAWDTNDPARPDCKPAEEIVKGM